MLPVLASSSARSSCVLENSSRLLGDVDLRFGGVVGRLVGALVDGEQQVALVDQRAVLEVDLVEIAGDARADGDLVDGLEASDELVVLDDLAHHRLGGGDHRQLLILRQRGAAERNAQQNRGRQHAAEAPAVRLMTPLDDVVTREQLSVLDCVHLYVLARWIRRSVDRRYAQALYEIASTACCERRKNRFQYVAQSLLTSSPATGLG